MDIIINSQAYQSGSKFRVKGRHSIFLTRSKTTTPSNDANKVIAVLSTGMSEEADLVEADLGLIWSSIKFFRISELMPYAEIDSSNTCRHIRSCFLCKPVKEYSDENNTLESINMKIKS